jgi:two-component system, NtrC family, response regulator AtoC
MNSHPCAFVFGRSPALQEIKHKVEVVANSDVPVLISGETGTGKEALAVDIHNRSGRSAGPFVKVNCAAIPAALIEAELFGFERGAFTGAVSARKGKFELASTGTIFLDEIAEVDVTLQPKLLQVLQDGNVSTIGGAGEVVLDSRVICSTNRDLDREVQQGRFRQDLFYRINVLHIQLPPLRERGADIPELVAHFLAKHSQSFGSPLPAISPSLLELFQAYSWPGNVRELENLLKQLAILGNEQALIEQLKQRLRDELQEATQPDGSVSLKKHIKSIVHKSEKELILKVLRHNRWNRKKTARMLRISYRALLYKLKDCGLDQRAHAAYGD